MRKDIFFRIIGGNSLKIVEKIISDNLLSMKSTDLTNLSVVLCLGISEGNGTNSSIEREK